MLKKYSQRFNVHGSWYAVPKQCEEPVHVILNRLWHKQFIAVLYCLELRRLKSAARSRSFEPTLSMLNIDAKLIKSPLLATDPYSSIPRRSMYFKILQQGHCFWNLSPAFTLTIRASSLFHIRVIPDFP